MDHAQIVSTLATVIAIMARTDDAMPDDCETLHVLCLVGLMGVECRACRESVAVEHFGAATYAIIRVFTSQHRRCHKGDAAQLRAATMAKSLSAWLDQVQRLKKHRD